MEALKNQVLLIGIGVIAILLIYCDYSSDKIRHLKVEIVSYEKEIKALQIEAQDQAKRYQEAKEDADDKVQQVQAETRRILAAKVPKDCQKAIDWGIRESVNFD